MIHWRTQVYSYPEGKAKVSQGKSLLFCSALSTHWAAAAEGLASWYPIFCCWPVVAKGSGPGLSCPILITCVSFGLLLFSSLSFFTCKMGIISFSSLI